MQRCVRIDDHAMIQALGENPGYITFGDYADVFMRGVFKHFHDNRGRVDVVFDCYTLVLEIYIYRQTQELSAQEKENLSGN